MKSHRITAQSLLLVQPMAGGTLEFHGWYFPDDVILGLWSIIGRVEAVRPASGGPRVEFILGSFGTVTADDYTSGH